MERNVPAADDLPFRAADLQSGSDDLQSGAADPRPRAADVRPRAADVRPRAADVRPRAADVRFRAADVRFRAAGPRDAPAVAGLHADSWRRHYRGALSDAFLDRDVAGFLLPLWTERLATPDPRARTILAEDDRELVGLAHTILDEDATWEALLDNLHVRAALKRQGVGSRLLALTGQAVLDWDPSSGLYLWVLEQNSAARAFYAARGAICVGRDQASPPGDDPANLNGSPVSLRYAWSDPSTLLPAGHPTPLPPPAPRHPTPPARERLAASARERPGAPPLKSHE